MGKTQTSKRSRAPALNPEAREAQLINLAINRAEEQLQNGTASSQVITHFLKLGTERARLEREKISAEVELAHAKVESIRSQQTSEELYQEAIKAFSSYSGTSYDEEEEFDEHY